MFVPSIQGEFFTAPLGASATGREVDSEKAENCSKAIDFGSTCWFMCLCGNVYILILLEKEVFSLINSDARGSWSCC